MKTLTVILALLVPMASMAWASEVSLDLQGGGISYGCDRPPVVTYGSGSATITGGACAVKILGLDNPNDIWSGSKAYAAVFALTSSTCDSVVAVFWYMDRSETWRVVPLMGSPGGSQSTVYRSPVFFGMKYLGHLEIAGYGRNVNFNVARCRVEWRDGTERKQGEEPSTWGALKGGFLP